MGNVPTKEQRLRLLSVASHGGTGPARSTRRHTVLSIASSGLFKKSEDKLRSKERHYAELVVRHAENVDGGYLAPHGTYKQLGDYNTEIVRALVVQRKLAPFYTPLQDYDAAWSDAEVAVLVRQSPLHALDSAYELAEDDADDHKIHRLQNYHKRQEAKRREQALVARMREEQRVLEAAYDAAKRAGDKLVALPLLVLALYRNAAECPICFLFYPPHMNYLRCCRQPICSECFVQIKRLDPHPPHDDQGDLDLPHTLISEYANCPYCAMANFGVTYEPPRHVHVGLGTQTAPGDYVARKLVDAIPESDENALVLSDEADTGSPLKLPQFASPRKPRRRSSVAADAEGVVTTDQIRPDWEQKLASARSKLARKAAAANTIHASNLIINEGSSALRPGILDSLEDRMVEEAMRLSLLDEERRKKKAAEEPS